MELDGLLESEVNFLDTPNKDSFVTFKEKLIAYGRIVNLDNIQSLNCKVKEFFYFEGWKNFFVLIPAKVYEDVVRVFYTNLSIPPNLIKLSL